MEGKLKSMGNCCLAVNRRLQGYGVGKALLKDAMLSTLQAADIAGIRCIAVHAKDDQAKAFYPQFDFIPSPTDPLHLFLLLFEGCTAHDSHFDSAHP